MIHLGVLGQEKDNIQAPQLVLNKDSHPLLIPYQNLSVSEGTQSLRQTKMGPWRWRRNLPG